MEPPPPSSSPGVSPVQLKDCIEELLKFVLTSPVNQTLRLDMGLSTDYCTNLLKEEDDHPISLNNPLDPHTTTDLSEGVLLYPLYRHLARGLYRSISSGAFCGACNEMTLIHEDSSLMQKEDEWNKLILEKGSEITNMLKSTEFELHVQEPFFTQLKDGLKTIEGRCAVGDYNRFGNLQEVLLGREGKVKWRPCNLCYKTSLSTLQFFSCHTFSSTLTDGARALAKHVNRGSDKYWGSFCGSDSNKNRIAVNVISHLIANCCWLNMHIVPPHGLVFEIRVANGYGARWSGNGSKFIGFLEPYMEDGHSKGWKH